MTKPLLKLGGVLLILLSLAFVIHTALMVDPLWEQILVMRLCYGFNYCLAVLIFWAVLATHKKNAILVGVVFMGGSMLKFGVFFFFIYPYFKLDGLVGRDELSLFFAPYIISLFSMTYDASRVLQRA
jgi:hypothetical protein